MVSPHIFYDENGTEYISTNLIMRFLEQRLKYAKDFKCDEAYIRAIDGIVRDIKMIF